MAKQTRINLKKLEEIKKQLWWSNEYQTEISNVIYFLTDFAPKTGIIYEVSDVADKKLVSRMLKRQK